MGFNDIRFGADLRVHNSVIENFASASGTFGYSNLERYLFDLPPDVIDHIVHLTYARIGSWSPDAYIRCVKDDLRSVAGAPAMGDTPEDQRLPAGSELLRITSTDPYWVHYDHVSRETLFEVASGSLEGERLIAVTFGHSALLPGFAGELIVPDHPPARDPAVADQLLAAGWAAVRRGLPCEG